MRTVLLALVLTFIMMTNVSTADSMPNKRSAVHDSIGRYQLFQGQYNSFDLKRQQTSLLSAVFMIDTATGVVKRYVNKIDEAGRYIEIWVATDQSVADTKK